MSSIYALRAGPSYVGFTFAKRCNFIVGTPNVTHARHLQYTMHPIRPNLRMEPSAKQIDMTDPVRRVIGEPVRGNRYFMDPSCIIRVGKKETGTTMRQYHKETTEALKYVMALEKVDAEHFTALPFVLPSVGIVILRDIVDENGREIRFRARAIYPHSDNGRPHESLEALLDADVISSPDFTSINRRRSI